MCARCASLKRTFPTSADPAEGVSAALLEQPESPQTRIRAAGSQRRNPPSSRVCDKPSNELSCILSRGQISAVPPTASQGLKQCRGVGEAAGLCLHQSDLALLIRLF